MNKHKMTIHNIIVNDSYLGYIIVYANNRTSIRYP